MIWQHTIVATIRTVCGLAAACLAAGLSLDQLTAAQNPPPVVPGDQ